MEWKYKIWLTIGGAAFTVFLALTWNVYVAAGLIALYAVLIPMTVWNQFIKKH